jgi:hypothetical protein
MVPGLELVLGRLNRRLRWALDQIKRLNAVREEQGTLEPEDDALGRARLWALGSYGRGELAGFSDLDLLIELPDHGADLHAHFDNRMNFFCDAVNGGGVEPIITVAHQGFAGEFQQHAFVAR